MSHPVDVHVGRKLKQIRTMRRLSQTDVAKELSLSFQQIQKYEIGSNRIAASRLYELSKILDVPTSYFFEGLETTAEADGNRDPGLEIVTALASIRDEYRQITDCNLYRRRIRRHGCATRLGLRPAKSQDNFESEIPARGNREAGVFVFAAKEVNAPLRKNVAI